jgi:hypothetical protein
MSGAEKKEKQLEKLVKQVGEAVKGFGKGLQKAFLKKEDK